VLRWADVQVDNNHVYGGQSMKTKEIKEAAIAAAKAARDMRDKADQENRGFTEEEALKFDQLTKEARRLEKEGDRQEELEAIEARLAAPKDKKTEVEFANGAKIEVVDNLKLYRAGQLRSFKGPEATKNAYTAGKWLMATIMNQAEARQWCRDHGVEIRVQTEGVNTAGGFLVPDVMERAIIDLREEYGDFRRNCRVMTMSSDHSIVPRRTGGVTAYFIGETTEITASDKAWNQVELTAKKLGALTRMSTDLSEDSVINVADDLANEMAYAFAAKEDACGIDGDGTSTYGGMLGIRTVMIDGVHLGSYVEAAAAGDNWSELDASDLTNVMAALPKYARKGAKWICSPTCKAAVFDRLALAAGANTAASIAAGALPAYAGYPIVEMAAMPSDDSSAALNDKIMLLFGNLAMASTLGDRRGITMKVSDQRYIEYDQIGIQATERFCIVNHDIGGAAATTRGPIVGLLGTT
jgi:HK97 family phage major capsid protein